MTVRRFLAALALIAAPLVAPFSCFGQAMQQAGPVVPGHAPVVLQNGYLMDGGAAAGGNAGTGIAELGLIARGTGAPPYVGQGSGPLGTNSCNYDAPVNNPGGYHYLCTSPNAQGGGLIAFGAAGGAPPLPLYFNINGTLYSYPGAGGPYLPIAGGTMTGPVQMAGTNNGVDIYANTLVTDGVTSNDVKFAAYANACAAVGGRLHLPSGRIAITGATSVTWTNCAFVGAEIPAGSTEAQGNGTEFVLTNQSVQPFICGYNVKVSGIAFYWPNQTGAVVYPPLFADDAVHGCGHWLLDNVTVVNAYIGFQQTAAPGWVDWKFSNSNLFACNADLSISSTPDGFSFSNVRVLPGAWLGMGGNATSVGTCASTQKVFHVTSGGSVSLTTTNLTVVGARYGFYVDSGGTVSESDINATWDVVGTIIDTSAGGVWSPAIKFSGINAVCATPATTWGSPNTGNASCFNMGSSGELDMNGFISAGSSGSFIATSGASVFITNSINDAIGGILDGADYYQVHVTAAAPVVSINGNKFSGNASTTNNQNAHVHGIVATASIASVAIQNNQFSFFQDEINVASASETTIIRSNSSSSTNGGSSITVTGSNTVNYGNNSWDKPPISAFTSASSCGGTTGTGQIMNGAFTGFIQVGGTTSVESCAFTLPFSTASTCVFTPSALLEISAVVSGLTWTVSMSSDLHGGQIFFNCSSGS
jgi:hypothetical protein